MDEDEWNTPTIPILMHDGSTVQAELHVDELPYTPDAKESRRLGTAGEFYQGWYGHPTQLAIVVTAADGTEAQVQQLVWDARTYLCAGMELVAGTGRLYHVPLLVVHVAASPAVPTHYAREAEINGWDRPGREADVGMNLEQWLALPPCRRAVEDGRTIEDWLDQRAGFPKEETVLSHVLDSEFDRYKVAIAASYAVVVAAAAARSSAQRGAKKKCVVL